MRTLLIFSFIIQFMTAHSQVMCDQFCVQKIEFDTSGALNATIDFSADSNLFINYPYVSAVIDIQGDTVATGYMFYFGQISNTVQDYPLTTDLSAPFPEDFEGFVIFNFDTVYCELYFPCEPTSLSGNYSSTINWNLFPNPAAREFAVYNPSGSEAVLTIFDATGRNVVSYKLNNAENRIELGDSISSGIYFAVIQDINKSEVFFYRRLVIHP